MDATTSELQRLRQRWDLAIQSAGFGVWDFDVKNERVHYSPHWTAALGYGDSDVPEHTSIWRSRVHPDDLQPMVAALTAHLANREPGYEAEFRLRTADGSYRWVLSRGRVVDRDEHGDALRAIGTLTDLTNRRQSDAHPARDASSEMLGRMSHELRTPLNAVLGFAQLLSLCIGGADVEQQRRYVGHIEDAGWRLLQMVDDLLDLSQLTQGRLDLHLEPVRLPDAIQAALEATAPLARQHAVQLRVGSVLPPATVRADQTRLRQVLVGLVDNAIKYNLADGSVTVDVGGPERGMWRISVADTGIGIDDHQLSRLFEPFQRLGRHRSPTEGLGIGLILVRSLVEMMGGRLEIASVVGQGSTLSVLLPADQPDTDGEVPPSAAAPQTVS